MAETELPNLYFQILIFDSFFFSFVFEYVFVFSLQAETEELGKIGVE